MVNKKYSFLYGYAGFQRQEALFLSVYTSVSLLVCFIEKKHADSDHQLMYTEGLRLFSTYKLLSKRAPL